MSIAIRTAREPDLPAANRIARLAFAEYEAAYPEWTPVLRDTLPMTELAAEAEVLLAEWDGEFAGTVGYVPPGRAPRYDFFPPEWALLRMMAVDPAHRGKGIAQALLDECVRLARQDNAHVLGLFTTPTMKAAVSLYRRAGFRYEFAIGPMRGAPCDVYVLPL
jgi:ribosomal protein S18 acetylase RimI-like enzyme